MYTYLFHTYSFKNAMYPFAEALPMPDDRDPRSSGSPYSPEERETQSSAVGDVLIGKASANRS